MDRQLPDERLERRQIEDLLGVRADVFRGQAHARALADPLPRILSVLEVAKLGVRGELRMVLVSDASVGQERLEAARVGPGVLRAAHSPPLADVHDLRNTGRVERADEAWGVELVDADRRDLAH